MGLMPPKVRLGDYMQSTVGSTMHHWQVAEKRADSLRTVMGFALPKWQRPLVWSRKQDISFLESLWRGLPVGTYTYNQVLDEHFDGLLVDGQQRMNALQRYFEGNFAVFGHFWVELGQVDKRRFLHGTHFPSFITKTTDEGYLRFYYDLMNFSGTPHKDSQRATALSENGT